MKTIGDRLKDVIERKHITINEIAEATGVSKSTIFRILNDSTKKTSRLNLLALADYLDIDIDWLLTGEEVARTNISINDVYDSFREFSELATEYHKLTGIKEPESAAALNKVIELMYREIGRLQSENASLCMEIKKLKERL